ncbi:hypothetical protein [Endozoicomonas sp. Mp262]|uniref:hypothetical protein n=1 Tax=Endozoicomonas sp. Mp262 TaxID=2919499 RepID=UPI0021D9FA7D
MKSDTSLSKLIEKLPKEHKPAPYEVEVRKGYQTIATRYVRATSPQRAVIAGIYWNNMICREKADTGTAKPVMPVTPISGQTSGMAV